MKHKKTITVNLMAPLVVGDPADPNGGQSVDAWQKFDEQLAEIRKLGKKLHLKGRIGVSVDVWWGLIEKENGKFDWAYYDKILERIIAAGLKWVPIISLHQCGGNVGDDRYVPIRDWVWEALAALLPKKDVKALKYVSEQGNASAEFISAWATHLALEYYERVFRAFAEHFADRKDHIAEINISLGPAGELRYPSYNAHDKGVDWPNRGALQCYSELALQSFRDYVFALYGNEDGIEKAWGKRYTREQITPPKNTASFFKRGDHLNTAYGKDFFDWYSDSLIAHGRMVMSKAIEVFAGEESAFAGIDLGAKIPGLHWRLGDWKDGQIVLGDRLAELPAGQIRTSGNDWQSDEEGRGYRDIVKLFADLNEEAGDTRVVLHFTCLEMADGGDGKTADHSLAASLVTWVGAEAARQGLTIKGENALGWNIPYAACWQRMRSHLAIEGENGVYEGLTLLRIGEVLESETARDEFKKLTELAAGDDDTTSGEDGGGATGQAVSQPAA